MKDNKITYTDYIEINNEIEHIEQIVTPPNIVGVVITF